MGTRDGPTSPTLDLRLQPKQQPQLTQRLIMSAHMQQAIHLLQLPLQELEPFIEEQVVNNPLLEISEEKGNKELEEAEREADELNEQDLTEKEIVISDKDFNVLKQIEEDFQDYYAENPSSYKRSTEEEKYKTYLESSIQNEMTLYQILIQQAHESFENPQDFATAEILIGYIDEYGFLTTPLKEIAALHHFTEDQLQFLLNEIQTFEPYGVGASTIQESLLIQLRCLHKENTLAYRIIKYHYTELIYNRIPLIQKALKCSFEQIQEAIDKDISKLDLHPGTHYSKQKNQAIIPDVSLRQEGEQLIVDVNRDYVPFLKLNRRYLKLLEDPAITTDTKHFIRSHLFSARWLMRNLNQRYSTVERIADSLARRQRDFFTQPDGKLVPLTMKALAEELKVHESTIARTVSNKYIYSPRGLLPLRSFFTTGYTSEEGKDLSSRTVRDAIVELIAQEDKHKPLSDEKICVLLREKGIPCARRTIAKYRAELQIGNTQQRRKFIHKRL